MTPAQTESNSGDNQDFRLSSLILPFYIPSGFQFLGVGVAIPLLALFARQLGAGNAGAAFIVGLVGAGSLVFNIPAGQVMGRFGIRRVIIVSTLVESCAAVAAGFSSSPLMLGIAAFVMGMTQTTFFVARLSYFRMLVPSRLRGRALSLVGGENRMGYFLGPIAGGFISQSFGFRYAFLTYAVLLAVTSFFLFLWVPLTARPEGKQDGWTPAQTISILRTNARVFATAGVSIVILQLMRTARQALVPLVADSLGLSVSRVGLVIGLMFFIEILLVYPAGLIMDRWGRKASGVPCLLFVAAGLAILALAHNIPVMLAAVIIAGIGNGLGSGINMTLSTDFAPAVDPGKFIGVWRFVVDLGTMSGPFIVGLIAAALSLSGASLVVALAGFGGAAIMGFLTPESRPRSVHP